MAENTQIILKVSNNSEFDLACATQKLAKGSWQSELPPTIQKGGSGSATAQSDPTSHQISGQPAVVFTTVGAPGTKNLTMIFGAGSAAQAELSGGIQGLMFNITSDINGNTMFVTITVAKAT